MRVENSGAETNLLVCVLRGCYVGVLVTSIEEPGDDARLTNSYKEAYYYNDIF